MNDRRDVYELLGIDARASTAVARELYWGKVARYLEAERAGDPGARAAIAELNEALAIVMDSALRAEYDRERSLAPRAAHASEDGASPFRWVLVTLVLGFTGGAVALLGTISVPAALAAAVAGVGALIVTLLRTRRVPVRVLNPHAVLQLHASASVEEMDTAYTTLAHEYLSRLHTDPGALQRLEVLDAAYLRARAMAQRAALPVEEGAAEGAAPPRGARIGAGALGVLRRLTWRALRGTVVLIGRGALVVGEWALRLAREPFERRADQRVANQDLQKRVESRLTTAFLEAAERIAVAPAEPAEVTAHLELTSSPEHARVAVGLRPLRVGSREDCDVVLQGEGVAPDHALVWVRGDAVLLHCLESEGACFVNGRPMTWAKLDDGDRIQLGDNELVVGLHD
ncbi:MAG: FHA domain-containing protein [Dehalococcoidia bacterium]